jgi:hypothetical protein
MHERVLSRNCTIWPVRDSQRTQKLSSPSQGVTARFDSFLRVVHGDRYGCGREFGSRYTRRFQQRPIRGRELLQLLLDQMVQTLRYPSPYGLRALHHLPTACTLSYDLLPHQLVHYHHQEQGVAVGLLAQDAGEPIWQGPFSKAPP